MHALKLPKLNIIKKYSLGNEKIVMKLCILCYFTFKINLHPLNFTKLFIQTNITTRNSFNK